jgi:hypothetical protein
VLGLADHAAFAAPAVQGGVAELPEAPRRLAGLGLRGGRGGQVGFARGAQARIAREAKDVVDAGRLAPRHQLVAGKARVRTQQDLHPRPSLADPLDDPGHRLDRSGRLAAELGNGAPTPFRRPSDVRGPQQGREQVPTTEHVQGQRAVAAVVAVEEPPLLLAMERVIGRVEIEDDRLRWPLVRLQQQIDEQVGAGRRVVSDLVLAVIGPQRSGFQPVERTLAGERRTIRPLRLELVGEQREHRIVAQLVVVAHVLPRVGRSPPEDRRHRARCQRSAARPAPAAHAPPGRARAHLESTRRPARSGRSRDRCAAAAARRRPNSWRQRRTPPPPAAARSLQTRTGRRYTLFASDPVLESGKCLIHKHSLRFSGPMHLSW